MTRTMLRKDRKPDDAIATLSNATKPIRNLVGTPNSTQIKQTKTHTQIIQIWGTVVNKNQSNIKHEYKKR